MPAPNHFSLRDLLDLCTRNRLIDRYVVRGTSVVIHQEAYVHDLTPEQAHLFLENLVFYARSNVHLFANPTWPPSARAHPGHAAADHAAPATTGR